MLCGPISNYKRKVHNYPTNNTLSCKGKYCLFKVLQGFAAVDPLLHDRSVDIIESFDK